MSSFNTIFTQEDYDLINAAFEKLWESAQKRCEDPAEREVIRKAFEFANEAHKNVRRRSGEPYMLHPLAVAQIVVDDIGLGYKSISAALLHDVVEDTEFSVDDLRQLFGDKIASLVDGLTKIKNVLDTSDKKRSANAVKSLQAENFKRILLTLNDDPRVVLIKLADRLHNCRTIEFMPENKRDKILSETMFIFIPLAHRLGLYSVKTELENIWLRFKEPDAYNEVERLINRSVEGRKADIDNFVAPIEQKLKDAGYTFRIVKRVKTPYSVWHKMQTKHVSFEEVYDLYAIRIIFDPKPGVPEREQCWRIHSMLGGMYRFIPERTRDWLAMPKPNGYEALHCTLIGDRGIKVEVQIRTTRMDDIAEKGIAAHWRYKQDGYAGEGDKEMDRWLERIQDILSDPDVNALELLDIIHNDLTSSEITVFTPKGEQRSIQNGATALDFAYLIHSEIGNTAIAAKANQKLVALSYKLKAGDQIEIITAAEERPKHEWMGFLQTRHAKALVMDYFRGERRQSIDFGRGIVDREIAATGSKKDNRTLNFLIQTLGASNAEDLYLSVGIGSISPDTVKELLEKKKSGSRGWLSNLFGGGRETPKAAKGVEINEQDGKYIIATCCNPIPGDSIVGFRAPDGSVTIHKKSCPVAEAIAATHGDLVVVPHWGAETESVSFPVRISMQGIDRKGLVNEITHYLSEVMGVNMRRIDIAAEEGIFKGFIDFYVNNTEVLEKVIRKLGGIDGIRNITRTDL
jgi:GTP pyrophosphokinase